MHDVLKFGIYLGGIYNTTSRKLLCNDEFQEGDKQSVAVYSVNVFVFFINDIVVELM